MYTYISYFNSPTDLREMSDNQYHFHAINGKAPQPKYYPNILSFSYIHNRSVFIDNEKSLS